MKVEATRERSNRRAVSKTDDRLAGLYAAHSAAAVRLAYFLTGDPHSAEDIAQEAFARLGGRLLILKDPDRAAGYLLRTVANLSKGHGRSIKRERDLGGRLPSPRSDVMPDLEERDEVLRSLMALPQRQRLALFVRYYLDMSETQAADALNCSTSAIKSLTHRASDSLRKQIEGEGP